MPVVVSVPPKKSWIGFGVLELVSELTLASPSEIHFEIAWLFRPKIGSSRFQSGGELIAL
jgi:hypothetical protein